MPVKTELVPEPYEIGNLIEEIVDHASQINLEVHSDVIQELLYSDNKELTIDELIEMQEIEQDIEELESVDLVQSEDGMTVENWKEGLSLIVKGYKV
ncbi:hypothetical protein TNCV_4149851 [Trichonephila clavipes]|uniref:Uncharacterized protein n=1 Tax=Trichonephila clavipes TaxID=2585209 RepID=A0A8X6W5I4_TRICX|nr:hypothetical protein TNCV_4149851 [Trichonephila clavipes]